MLLFLDILWVVGIVFALAPCATAGGRDRNMSVALI